jgi:hypothetical protein
MAVFLAGNVLVALASERSDGNEYALHLRAGATRTGPARVAVHAVWIE